MATHPALKIIVGGLVAGLVDVGAAALINWVDPTVILRAIATGVLGKAAFRGGWQAALLGLGLQCAMSIVIAGLYVGVVSRSKWLRQHWILAGLVAGPVIFTVMEFVVVPLSRAAKAHFTPVTIVPNLAAMMLFGLIIAFFTRRRR
ncbi:MAG: hypothetical protein JWO51_2795 [Rhodospirillales bacterium]|nr:hypothetical protein [Rhodospirillales bacterium]